MRDIDTIVVHCTATRANWFAGKSITQKVQEVRRWHVDDNGWSDIGYHYLIDRDGKIAEGRPVEREGAHARGYNATSIGIALIGGHGSTRNDDFLDNFTPEQDKALRGLIQRLEVEHPGIHKIIGHNEVSAKACPGFQVQPWLAQTPVRTNAVQSKTIQASAVTAAAGGAGTILSGVGGLSETAQLAVIVLGGIVVLGSLFIMRERLKAWASGWR
jgi:N-acetylmuramoyl-L-alanine amidase